jgi:hypothetical protein
MVEQTAPSGRLRLVVVSIDRLDPGRAIVSDADTVFLERTSNGMQKAVMYPVDAFWQMQST